LRHRRDAHVAHDDLALELAARSANWRTLLPGDEVTLPPGAVWWSANHFTKMRG
jgi:hypothetical protein